MTIGFPLSINVVSSAVRINLHVCLLSMGWMSTDMMNVVVVTLLHGVTPLSKWCLSPSESLPNLPPYCHECPARIFPTMLKISSFTH